MGEGFPAFSIVPLAESLQSLELVHGLKELALGRASDCSGYGFRQINALSHSEP
jgi:hypothetical protein